jgi:hypothetical protein
MKLHPADLRLYYLQRAAPKLFDFPEIQTYFPALEVLFPSLVEQAKGSPTLAAAELVTEMTDSTTATVENLVTKGQRQTPVWVRKVHLLEPLDVLSGEYVAPRDGSLPAPRGPWQRALRKLNEPYNEAYTDAVFACMASRLVETGRSPHFCRFFGTFNGRTQTYKYDITDDMEDLETEEWFQDGLNQKLFDIEVEDMFTGVTTLWSDMAKASDVSMARSLLAKRVLELADERTMTASTMSESGDETDTTEKEEAPVADTATGEELEEVELEVSGTAYVNRRAQVRLNRVSDSQDSHTSSSSDYEDDIIYRLIVKDFPVQLSVLERCDGTMDALMDDEFDDDATDDMRETKEERWAAWIFQVIAGLAAAQQAFDFVHNDLHTANVVWTGTGVTHLYYHIQGAAGGDRFYRVPTYGRIFKIIDFGRATFRPPAAATRGNHMWISDAYAPGGDAYAQYNCGPYFDQTQPKVQPNKSFDLCRLAVAMLGSLWPEDPAPASGKRVLTRELGRTQFETVSPLWNLLWLWLTDKEGRNILRNPDDSERYPKFDLYCAIARDSNNAVPAQQLTLPLFNDAFRCRRRDIPAGSPVWKLYAVNARL